MTAHHFICTRPLILRVSIVTTLLLSALTTAKSQEMFQYVDMAVLELTVAQQKILDKLSQEATTTEVRVARISPEQFRGETLRFNLADGRGRSFRTTSLAEMNDGGVTWTGAANQEDPQLASFSVRDGNGNGTFVIENEAYNVRPLGNGLHALIKRDSKKAGEKEEPPAFKKIEQESSQKQHPRQNLAADAPNRFTIRVMVAYTEAVASNHVDVRFFIDHVLDVSNQCFAASNVPVTLELARAEQVDYVESNVIENDVSALVTPDDGKIDNLHQLREDCRADIVVLLIDNADAYGMAADIMADADKAFAVVDDEVADWYFTFVHELGHLFGCRHDPDADPSTSPFPYGHCFVNVEKNWRTIMAYGSTERVGIFSSPHLRHPDTQGDIAGSAEVHDNCRVLRETAARVAGFRN